MATQVNNPPAPIEQKPVAPSPEQQDSARSRTPFSERETMFVKEGLAPAPVAPESPAAQTEPPKAETSGTVPSSEAQPKPTEAPPDAGAPKEPASPEPPKLYAGKYKTPEELEKAYQEAQRIISKQGAKVNQTLEEIARDAAKAKEAAPLAAVSDEMPDPVTDLDKFKAWQVAQLNRVRYESIAQDKYSKAVAEFNEQYKDLVDAQAMEWVNSRLLIDNRFVQGYQKFLQDPITNDLSELRAVATEHADYVRSMIAQLRVAGRTEERQKQAEIMPQLTPQSPERPPSGTPSTAEDPADEYVRLRQERLNKIRTPAMRH